MTSLLVFAFNVISDVLWVLFIRHVNAGHRVRASLLSVGIVGLGYCSVLFIVSETYLILPALIGCFVGTFFTVGRKQ